MPETPQGSQDGVERDILFQSRERQGVANDVFYEIMKQTKRDVKNDMVEYLSNKAFGTRKIPEERTVNGKTMTTYKSVEGWYDSVPGVGGLMSLQDAIQIANYIAGQAGENFSITYFAPAVNTLNIAAALAMVACHQLDNPRYNFKGNETDAAAFASKTVSLIHSVLNRSINGYMTNKMAETTTNINRNERREEEGIKMEKESALNKMLGIGKK